MLFNFGLFLLFWPSLIRFWVPIWQVWSVLRTWNLSPLRTDFYAFCKHGRFPSFWSSWPTPGWTLSGPHFGVPKPHFWVPDPIFGSQTPFWGPQTPFWGPQTPFLGFWPLRTPFLTQIWGLLASFGVFGLRPFQNAVFLRRPFGPDVGPHFGPRRPLLEPHFDPNLTIFTLQVWGKPHFWPFLAKPPKLGFYDWQFGQKSFQNAMLLKRPFWGFTDFGVLAKNGHFWPFLTNFCCLDPNFDLRTPFWTSFWTPNPDFGVWNPIFGAKEANLGVLGLVLVLSAWFWSWFGQTLKIEAWNLVLDPFQTDFWTVRPVFGP